jgi:hypothetical protein
MDWMENGWMDGWMVVGGWVWMGIWVEKNKNEEGYTPLRTCRSCRCSIPINSKRKQMHGIPKLKW